MRRSFQSVATISPRLSIKKNFVRSNCDSGMVRTVGNGGNHVSRLTRSGSSRKAAAMVLATALLLHADASRGQTPPSGSSAETAARMADFFGSIGDQIFKECLFELSDEQIEVQQALVRAYIARGGSPQVARELAAKQIQPPKLSEQCEKIRRMPATAVPGWDAKTVVAKPAVLVPEIRAPQSVQPPSMPISLTGKAPLQLWDCAPGVDYVTIKHNGYERKLTGGEICNPFEDVVREVPADLKNFRLGYTIRTGRVFIIAEGSHANGKTIAWGLSGRDICRNNPDPDCLATRAVGPLPPGEYSFAADKAHRVTWGPKTKRQIAAVYLSKLWHRERFSAKHTQAILARGNIAIHLRLKGEMSEACIGLEPKSWAYIAELIKSGRATSLNVHIDDPHPQIAEKPPVITKSSFSLSSLFK
jgi:hypothetical protein